MLLLVFLTSVTFPIRRFKGSPQAPSFYRLLICYILLRHTSSAWAEATMSKDIFEFTTPIFTPQAQSTPSFVPPEGFTDNVVPLPVVWDHHLKHSPEHPLFRYYEPGTKEQLNGDMGTEENGTIVDVSWGKSVKAIYRSVKLVKRDLATLGLNEMSEIEGKPVVVGILALAGALRL